MFASGRGQPAWVVANAAPADVDSPNEPTGATLRVSLRSWWTVVV